MADNIAITAGSGTTIATDDVSSVHYQFVKLADGTLNSSTVVAAGNGTNGSALRVTIASDSTGVIGLAAGSNNIGDVDVLSVVPGTGATNLGKAIDTALGATDTGVLAMAVRDDTLATLTEADGDVTVLRTDSTGRLWCNVSNTVTVGSHAVTNAGTFAVQMDGSALTALQLIDDPVFADDTGFTVGTSKVMMAGVNVVAHGSNPDAADANDAAAIIANRHRVPFVIGGHPNVITLEQATTGSQTDVAVVTISTGSKIVVTQAQFVTDNANTAFPQARLGFGTANTPTTTGVVLTHPGLPAGGGISRGDGSGMLGVGADNEDLRITNGAPTGGSIRTIVSYYTIES